MRRGAAAASLGQFAAKNAARRTGSGGGSPGLPLAVSLPGRTFTLLEAERRKCRFLERFAAELPNVGVVWGRAEEQAVDVYGVALELHGLCCTLVAQLNRIVKDQLERASLSVVLNIAEAAGRRSRRDKARFYAIARGSATEVAALLDVLALRRLASPAQIRSGRRLAIRIVQMLTRIEGRIRHQPLSRASPFCVPVLVQIGRERVSGDAAEMILDESADLLIAEVMDDAEPPSQSGAAA